MEDIENLTIIWIGPAPEELSSTFIFTKQFDSIELCEVYLKLFKKNDRIYFIMANVNNVNISQLIKYPQIIAFYLYKTKLNVEHTKIHGNFDESKSLFDKIHNDIRFYYRNFSAPWSVFDWPEPQTSLNQLSVDNVSFVWSQILLDILYKLPTSDDEQAKEEWLAECRHAYSNDANNIENKRIDKFEREYCSDDATKWYSDSGFAYRLLNQALRTKNIDIIYKCRFMIRQMYQQLAKIQKDQRESDLTSETVYRGQEITEEELKKLQRSGGQLISMNAFLSTSVDPQVANCYLSNYASSSNDKHWIEFTITIDPEVGLSHIFAYIGMKNLSTKPDEMEVLFAPCAVFRIETVPIRKENDHIWRMNLRLARNDQCLKMNRFKEEIREKHSHYPNSLFTLASVLAEMGQTSSALLFYRMLIQQSNSNSKLPEYDLQALFSDIGSLYFDIGNYYEAIRFYEKVYDLISKHYPPDFVSLVRVHSHMGSTYMELGHYKRARYFYDWALTCANFFPNKDFDTHALLYNNLGRLEQTEKKFEDSLKYYQKSINIIEKHLNGAFKYLFPVRNNMANVYQENKRYDEAIELYMNLIELCKEKLLSEDTLLVKIYSNISLCYSNQNKLDDAEPYIKMSIDLANAQQSLNQDLIAACHNVYAVYYDSKKQYMQAYKHAKLSLEHAKQIGLSNDHPDMKLYQEFLKNIQTNIGNVSIELEGEFK